MVDHLEIANIDTILNFNLSGEAIATVAEFKLAINAYLEDLVVSPVRSLADIIAFNLKFSGVVSKSGSIPFTNPFLYTIEHRKKGRVKFSRQFLNLDQISY